MDFTIVVAGTLIFLHLFLNILVTIKHRLFRIESEWGIAVINIPHFLHIIFSRFAGIEFFFCSC